MANYAKRRARGIRPGERLELSVPVEDTVFLTFKASNSLRMPDGNSYSMWVHVILAKRTGEVLALEAQIDPEVCETIRIDCVDTGNPADLRPHYFIRWPCHAPFRVLFKDPEVLLDAPTIQKAS